MARALREGLEREEYEVVVAPTGEDGFFLVNAEEFDLVILDLMLPGRDGLQVLATLRKRRLQTPVLILTARDAIEERVRGLDSGADDYLVKPFAFPELLARVRARLRRGRAEQTPNLRLADLEMEVLTRKAKRSGQNLELAAREFELLEYLLRHKELMPLPIIPSESSKAAARGKRRIQIDLYVAMLFDTRARSLVTAPQSGVLRQV